MNTNTVKQAMKVDIAISAPMAEALQTWSQFYENKATWLNADTHSLNLPAAIAGEIARSVTIEMKVDISGSARAKYLTEQLALVLPKLRQMVEFGAAKGGLMFKPYSSNKNILVDYVQADQFFPVAFDANGNITSCIFSDQRTIGDKYYTRLEYHNMTPEGCVITNQAFKSTTKDTLGQPVVLTEVDVWKDLEPEAIITGIDKPLFSYFKFPLANNIDPTSPLGASCYARVASAGSGGKCLIQQADEQWSNFLWEFDSGKRAMYVDVLAFGKDADGKPILPNKRLYRTIDTSGNVGENGKMFEEWTPNFREVNLLNGLDAILRKIEFACGLAYGTLSNPQTVDKTATELKIAQQRSYATIADTQKALQVALDQLLWAMDIWATLDKLAPVGTYLTSYDWDDSIIVDSDAQKQSDLELVGKNLMSGWEFRMRNFGEDEVTAKAKIAEIPADEKGRIDLEIARLELKRIQDGNINEGANA